MNLKSEAIIPSAELFQEDFVKLSRLCQQVPTGLAILDPNLRYLFVNEYMAAINGIPVERHAGRSIREVDPGVASALESSLRQVIAAGEPLEDLDAEVLRPAGFPEPGVNYWLVNCYPLKGPNGTVQGVGLFLRDVTERKLKDAAQDELLKFEAILSDLSAAFINVPVAEVDAKIEEELHKIVDFLGFDRSTVWRVSPENGEMICTHSYSLPGITKPPVTHSGVVPQWDAMVHQGEIFKVSDVDELPDTFWKEKQYCKEYGGIKSILFIPAAVGGVVEGFITFVSYTVKRAWPDLLIQRLRLLWEVFANALERKRAVQKIQKALAEIESLKDRLEAENLYLRDRINIEHKYEKIIGKSDAIQKVLLQAEQVAPTDSTVLIQGETGTGKELIAGAIHSLSSRKSRTMVKLNCAALPSTLIEAELFGHEKGAYTGASSRQIGRFEAANGSTIFLDEIGELPLELQAKLLRVLQEGQFERLGSSIPVEVDVRVIAATNRNLLQAVKEGKFREDLYYRLNVFPISVPSLRERREDISLLVWAMVKEFGKAFEKSIERIPKTCMEALERYQWPGNIRELRNAVERAMILSHGPVLFIDVPDNSGTAPSTTLSLEEMERLHITAVLESAGWRVRGKNGAAEILKVKATTLDAKMKKLGITRKLPVRGA
ncbi:MAG: sigma 54-interacting transcriptional regulator [Deltaproteobacteria bacterium]|nr:sigma 54-interacting transcriptional regulator [Deltaproteobacteria bacterium]